MPVPRNRPLLFRPRRSFDYQQRQPHLLSTPGLISDSYEQRTAISSSDGFDGYGADKAYTVQSGAFSCSGGKLVCTSAGIVTINPASADNLYCVFPIGWTTDANNHRFAFRFTDVNNYLGLVITSTAAQFQTIIAGTPAGLGTATTGVSPTLGDVVAVAINGNAFGATIFRNGAQIGTSAVVASNSTGAGVTPIGFRAATTALVIPFLTVRKRV